MAVSSSCLLHYIDFLPLCYLICFIIIIILLLRRYLQKTEDDFGDISLLVFEFHDRLIKGFLTQILFYTFSFSTSVTF